MTFFKLHTKPIASYPQPAPPTVLDLLEALSDVLEIVLHYGSTLYQTYTTLCILRNIGIEYLPLPRSGDDSSPKIEGLGCGPGPVEMAPRYPPIARYDPFILSVAAGVASTGGLLVSYQD